MPIAVGVQALKGPWTTAWESRFGGLGPCGAAFGEMFFAMQKHFVARLTFGAAKGPAPTRGGGAI